MRFQTLSKATVGHADLDAQGFRRIGLVRLSVFEKLAVGLADLCSRLVVEERQEGIPPSSRDLRHGVKEWAGEHDRAARRGLVAARTVLRKADLATLEIRIEVDRYRIAPVSRALGGIVPMGIEMPSIFS